MKKDMRSSFWNLKTPWILVRMLQNSGEKDVYPSIWNLKTPWFWYGCCKILVKKTPSVVTFRPRLASQEWLTWIIKDLEVSKGSFLSESLKWIKKNAKSLFWVEIWISCLLLLAENSNFLLRKIYWQKHALWQKLPSLHKGSYKSIQIQLNHTVSM